MSEPQWEMGEQAQQGKAAPQDTFPPPPPQLGIARCQQLTQALQGEAQEDGASPGKLGSLSHLCRLVLRLSPQGCEGAVCSWGAVLVWP